MHKCAGVHDAMTTMTKLKSTTSEQHVDLGVSRCKRDYQDLKKIQLTIMNLLTWMLKKLCSLSSGLTAMDGDGINPDKTEEVACYSIAAQWKKYLEGYIKRGDILSPSLICNSSGKAKIHIDPTILFSRLIAIVEREEDTKLYFDYELSSFPTSLFKDGLCVKV